MLSKRSFVPGGECIQTVRIVLDDGREGIFTGKAICDPENEQNLSVKEVLVSAPENVDGEWQVDEVDIDLIRDKDGGDTVH